MDKVLPLRLEDLVTDSADSDRGIVIMGND